MSTEQAVLRLENIKKSFGDNEVLHDISLTVHPGEVVAVIGASGGGKSTLLRCATLLEQIDAGEIHYGDIAVATTGASGKASYGKADVLRQAKAKFGLVFQNYNLFPHYRVLKNIMDAPICVQKRDKTEVERQARDLIKKMGLEGNENKVPCELSGGQQQRVAIARALCLNPEILFFDEPTSALDPVLKVIRQLAAEHMTMVIVTHEMSFARDVADRIIFMDKGVIVEEGPAAEVINNPKHQRTREFLATYGG